MSKTKVEIQFDGSHYFGWQIQGNVSPTIQEEFNLALKTIYKQEVKTVGSGRTDAKVHAVKFYVVFEPPFLIPNAALVKALNANLPQDIRAISAEEVSSDFRPTSDALKREYRYLFTNNEQLTPFQLNYIANISYELDFDAMKKACEEFIGTYNFASYQTTGSEVKTTLRTIYECSLQEVKVDFHGIFPSHYFIKVVGSGFLKQMVRLMVGAIWDVGKGKITPLDIRNSLTENVGKHIAPVAPAQGLYKYDIQY